MELNKIYNMDCEKGLEKMIADKNLIDGVITSPPYNIIRPNSNDRGYDEYKDGMSNEEYINWTIRLFDKMDKVIKPNGKILYNMSYGCENTECMNLTVAEIIKKQILHWLILLFGKNIVQHLIMFLKIVLQEYVSSFMCFAEKPKKIHLLQTKPF